MSSTRSVISPGVFAASANTTIPSVPVQGVSYRDPTALANVPNGWPYFQKVNSAEFNQWMYQYTSLISIIDKKGVLGWSDQVDYTEAAIVFGSDGNLYKWIQASGPNNGGAQDPISATTYWQNALSQNDSSVQGNLKNLQVSATGTSAAVAASFDELVLGDGAGSYFTDRNVSGSIVTTATGAGGLDTGSLAASTWYSLWRIRNPSTGARNWLFSLSQTSPTMPSGFTQKARFGWFRTDSTANRYPLSFKQNGNRVQYVVAPGTNVTQLPVGASGVQGSIGSTVTYAAVSLAAFLPATARSIRGVMQNNYNGGTLGGVAIAPNASYSAVNSGYAYVGTNGGATTNVQFEYLLESMNIYFAGAAAGSGMQIIGWEDSL